ncbi:MAG: hypothetical protein OXR68_00675 [Alphaproteobacteria bacterium]|nr:hypothetical protein [Alphaproteobacteria bacterium]MDD9919125.1 hypothetical protein [Alphaproteobacteria bacterium]
MQNLKTNEPIRCKGKTLINGETIPTNIVIFVERDGDNLTFTSKRKNTPVHQLIYNEVEAAIAAANFLGSKKVDLKIGQHTVNFNLNDFRQICPEVFNKERRSGKILI